MVIFASLFGLYSFCISRVRPVHSFFEKESILENPPQIFTNLFFNAYLTPVLFGKLVDNGGGCLKSQTFFSENRESAFGLVVVRSILVSRGLLGQPGGGGCLNGQTFLSENQEFALGSV